LLECLNGRDLQMTFKYSQVIIQNQLILELCFDLPGLHYVRGLGSLKIRALPVITDTQNLSVIGFSSMQLLSALHNQCILRTPRVQELVYSLIENPWLQHFGGH